LPHEEVLERLAQTHALLLVSDYEGLPHVAIEALACGVPLIALPVGGTRSVLRDGENGIVLGDASHQAVARALETLRDDAEVTQRLADGARRSGAEWGMDRCASQIVELLDRAMSGKPRAIFVGKSKIPTPMTEGFRGKLEILVRHLEPTIVGVGRPGRRAAGRARLVRFPATGPAGLDGLLFYSFGPAVALSLAAGRRRCAIVCQSPYEAFGVLLLTRALPKSLRPRVVVEVHGDWRTAARLYGGPARRPIASSSDRAAAWAVRRGDRVRVVSGWLERLVRETGYRGDLDRFVAYSDMAEFLAAPVLLPPVEPRAAYVGALDRSKGVDVLLEAWSRVTAQIAGARLFIGGDGPMREDLRARCERLGLNGTAEFVGYLSSSEVRTLLDRCSCLVVPSRSEGLGRVALEAMARARPVVASKVGGLPELVDEGRNGRLVAPEDPEQLASAIVQLFQDPDEVLEMGREGRRRALERDPLAEFESGISRLAAWVGAG
nr:glycosyltransferase [Actinomycetota bacterium]